jgi:hypothetical protein
MTKSIKWPKGVDVACLPQHKRLATGQPLLKAAGDKGKPRTPA